MTTIFRKIDCFLFPISQYGLIARLIPSNKIANENQAPVKEPMFEKITRTLELLRQTQYFLTESTIATKTDLSRISKLVFFAKYFPEFPFQIHH